MIEKLLEMLARIFLLGTAQGGPVDSQRFDQAAALWAARRGAELVTAISERTRDRLRALTNRAIRENWTVHEFQEHIEEDRSGLFSRDRALMIARTETAFAFNQGEADRWLADGIEFVEILDGVEDEFCEHANGSVWTLEEYRAHPIAHPNCQRSAIPIVGDFDRDRLTTSIDPR